MTVLDVRDQSIADWREYLATNFRGGGEITTNADEAHASTCGAVLLTTEEQNHALYRTLQELQGAGTQPWSKN